MQVVMEAGMCRVKWRLLCVGCVQGDARDAQAVSCLQGDVVTDMCRMLRRLLC